MRVFRLYRYELSKLFHYRFAKISMIIAFILVIACGVYSTGLIYELTHSEIVSDTYYQLPKCKSDIFYNYSEVYSEAYFNKVKAEWERLNEEDLNITENDAKSNGKYGLTKDMDSVLFSDLYEQCVNMQECMKIRTDIAESAQDIIESETNPYLIKRAELAKSAYSSQLYLKTYYDDALSGYIENFLFFGRKSYAFHITVLLICFLCGGIFAYEHENGIYSMLYTSRNGRSCVFWAKFLVCITVVVSVTSSVLLIGLLIYAIRYCGIYGFESSLQLLDLQMIDFSLCPFDISNLQFLFVCFGMEILFFLLLVMLALIVSIVSKKTIAAFLSGVIVGIGSLEIFYYLQNNTNTKNLRLFELLQSFLPSALLFPQCYYTQMNIVNVNDYPVYRIYILLAVCVVMLLLMLLVAYSAYTKMVFRTIRKLRRVN